MPKIPEQPVIRDPQKEMRERRGVLPDRPRSLLNLEDYIETVTTIPTGTPKDFYSSIKLRVDGLSAPTTYHLYVYSAELAGWVKFTGAAA